MRGRACALASAAIVFSLLARPAGGAIIFEDLSTSAPPLTLGGYGMLVFADDARPVPDNVASVPAPTGGDVGFDQPLSHLKIGVGWSTWSHGYAGDVYYQAAQSSGPLFPYTVGLTLPAGIVAFYLYAEPEAFSEFDITAIDQNGQGYTRTIAGNAGARGFGFYATAGDTITGLSIGSFADFAIGEFGISKAQNVPEPTALALLGLGMAAAVRARRRRHQGPMPDPRTRDLGPRIRD